MERTGCFSRERWERKGEDELRDRSAWSSGDNPASGLMESQRSRGPLEWGGLHGEAPKQHQGGGLKSL